MAETLVGNWPQFWTGNQIKGWGANAGVDNQSYPIMGNPGQGMIGVTANTVQISLTVTPITSVYVLQAGPVAVTITFLSPVEQSIPLFYLSISVVPTDGKSHSIQIEADISAEWANGHRTVQVQWATDSTVTVNGGILQTFTVESTQQTVFSWGTVVWSNLNANRLTWQSGDDAITIRKAFCSNGTLGNTNDATFRAINAGYPIFAFSNDLGSVGSTASQTLTDSIGHVRAQAIQRQSQTVNAYWTNYDWQGLLQYFYNEYPNAVPRNSALDSKTTNAATAAYGNHYAAILALATRQAFGGMEFVNPTAEPYLMLKEISADDIANLALKGILAIGEMGRISNLVGNSANASHYTSTAQSYISTWNTNTMDSSGKFVNLESGKVGTYELIYNAFPYQKSAWERWIAASSNATSVAQVFVDDLFHFLKTSPSHVPFTDNYNTVADTQKASILAKGLEIAGLPAP
ncbi:hypothetical protein BZG36_02117 [Bifiguratus adelaidae]|uniref:DUF1793 domain-containing protein n=1 Tax=Bifiguratus adelaidae TaxID=1938954 RepID=A0A261Y315_9FUNG|nr:hypothetical protein BZG36_02117 [Bifiguratus adelaidae]